MEPIERTIVWNHPRRCWLDKALQIPVDCLGSPGNFPSAAPSQPNDDELTERLRGIARDEIAHFLAGHTARTQMYFCEPDKLATVAFVLEQNANDRYIGDTIYNHSVRIARLEVPWWKRWFTR